MKMQSVEEKIIKRPKQNLIALETPLKANPITMRRVINTCRRDLIGNLRPLGKSCFNLLKHVKEKNKSPH